MLFLHQGNFPALVISPGSYLAGVTQSANANGLKVKAQFDGTSDALYATGTSPELSYSVDSSGVGTGDSDTTPDDTPVWTTLTVGTATSGDVCTFNGVAGADADKDGLCDRWEIRIRALPEAQETLRHIGMLYVLLQDLTSELP